MDTFKKHFIDSHGNYRIGYYSNEIFQKFVNENKPLYVEWITQGNIPDEISYIPPIPPTIDQKKSQVRDLIIDKQNNAFNSGISYNNTIFPSDPNYREIMNTGARIGQTAIDNSLSITLSAFNLSGNIELLDELQTVELRDTYDQYGLNVYNIFVSEMIKVSTATSEQLDYYITHYEFE